MPNLTSVLRDEIGRLSRKAIRKETKTTRRISAQHRRTLAELKRQVDDLLRRLTFLESQEKRRVSNATQTRDGAEKARFSPKWLKSHRQRLGLSAADYARLVGVSGLTVYNWEQGKSKPREQHMPRLAEVRALKKREAVRRLEMLGG